MVDEGLRAANVRLSILQYATAAIFIVLGAGFWVLQVVEHAKFRSNRDLRDNGWFVFFAPRDHPQIAGVVFVEHGGHGGTTAAPIARHVLETFFAKQDGLPLPILKGLVTTPADGEEPVAPPTAAPAR